MYVLISAIYVLIFYLSWHVEKKDGWEVKDSSVQFSVDTDKNNRMDFLCEVAMSDSIGGDGDGETETSEVGGEGIDGEEMEGEGEEGLDNIEDMLLDSAIEGECHAVLDNVNEVVFLFIINSYYYCYYYFY